MTLDLPHDKTLHVIAGVVVYAVAHFVSPVVGFGAVVSAGIGKEIYDLFHRDKHTPEVMDAVATIAGGIIAFICSI